MTTRIVRCLLMAGALLAIPAQAQDYHPAFHPETLKGPPAGKSNTVLVLGTPHLSGLPDGYGPGVIEPLLVPLLDRLATWKPTAIATEDLSGCNATRCAASPIAMPKR